MEWVKIAFWVLIGFGEFLLVFGLLPTAYRAARDLHRRKKR